MEGKITVLLLGDQWQVRESTIDVKPSRFIAVGQDDIEVSVIWGAPSDLKHIVWAGLIAPSYCEVQLVVVTTPSQPLTSDVKSLIRTLELKLGTEIRVIEQ
ncbi:hypothetical protein HT102_00470 [Hoyosella sp. G463]|uniref:Uncharacterized protein n=1 Tax=Lolliginicoccus lacisalsi TaxID=2742202 RepID=A0A927J9F8_9ACTN|nr:hypothetical protein [Lolliginicoccus lacisalsi]MBD8504961.1 hypothetical protein [Lolliginicoccus lacisalsi]